MPAVELHAVCHGEVQGVGFRYKVNRLANGSALNGWVKNLSDGSVEIVVQGSREELESFVSKIKALPYPVSIKHIDVDFSTPGTKMTEFSILKE